LPDRIVYDVETYPNVFTLAAEHVDYPLTWCFEISPWRNDYKAIVDWVMWLRSHKMQTVGFNNIGFDYPILHDLLKNPHTTAATLYAKCQEIIQSQDFDKWQHMVYPSERYVEQIDLYKIHHFDNKARATGLKALEFAMRLDNVSDLPFPVGTVLNQEQTQTLKQYNAHDVSATKRFYHVSKKAIEFRESLTVKHGRDFMNHNSVKIGKEIFQMELERAGVQLYKYGPSGRQPAQTPRTSIALKDCIPPFITFADPEFKRIHEWMHQQVITVTKGAFEDVSATVGGLEFFFGTGGIHASVSNKVFESDSEYMILDVDVTSLYPSIAIEHGYYPEHLGPRFVDVYRTLRTQRIGYKKGSLENEALKLALNGTYGASNDAYSVFYDPLFTMKITIGGQLMLAMLAEWLMTVGANIIQANTDGITMQIRRDSVQVVRDVYKKWEKLTKLSLEEVEYTKMAIADVNSYIAIKPDGEVKRKGRYEYELDWHKNASELVVAKVAEKVLVEGADPMELLLNWPDKMDFMARIKIPRNACLIGKADTYDVELPNTTRYYVSEGGVSLVKKMKPLPKAPTAWRYFNQVAGFTVCVCNDIRDATLPIDYQYYLREVLKLTKEFK